MKPNGVFFHRAFSTLCCTIEIYFMYTAKYSFPNLYAIGIIFFILKFRIVLCKIIVDYRFVKKMFTFTSTPHELCVYILYLWKIIWMYTVICWPNQLFEDHFRRNIISYSRYTILWLRGKTIDLIRFSKWKNRLSHVSRMCRSDLDPIFNQNVNHIVNNSN